MSPSTQPAAVVVDEAAERAVAARRVHAHRDVTAGPGDRRVPDVGDVLGLAGEVAEPLGGDTGIGRGHLVQRRHPRLLHLLEEAGGDRVEWHWRSSLSALVGRVVAARAAGRQASLNPSYPLAATSSHL